MNNNCNSNSYFLILFSSGVVGSFFGDGYVVGMAFRHSACRDAGKLRLFEFGEVFRSAVTHTGTKSSDKLVDGFLDVSFVGNPSQYALVFLDAAEQSAKKEADLSVDLLC